MRGKRKTTDNKEEGKSIDYVGFMELMGLSDVNDLYNMHQIIKERTDNEKDR